MKKVFFLSLLTSCFWASEDLAPIESFAEVEKGAEFVSDKETPLYKEAKAKEGDNQEPILETLRAIVLLSSPNQLRSQVEVERSGVILEGVALLEKNPHFLRALEQDFINRPLTERSLGEIKSQITEFYQQKNQPFVVVSIPRQELTNGILQILVDEAKLGEIRSVGNRYVAASYLKEKIRARPGETILMNELLEDLGWLNQNPFRRTDAIFTPGKAPGTTDIELVTIDRWPYRFYMGADNTGTIPTERNRLFFGFNFGNTIWKDAQLSYQFTSAPNWNRLYAHTGMYRIPLPWRHTVVFYGGYTHVEPSLNGAGFKERGYNWQVDARYRIPLMETPKILQSISFGYDFKQVSNRIKFNGQSVFKADADINQLVAGYELGFKKGKNRASFVAELFVNPGSITTNNNTRSYRRFRAQARAEYGYLRIAHSFARKTSWGWQLGYDLTGQMSSQNLLPSEQFTLTGYNAVRGFEERIVNVDNGAIFNLQLETPHWSFTKYYGKGVVRDDFYLIAFCDVGVGGNHDNGGGGNFVSLGSIGPGARYQFGRYVSARFDYGIQLWHAGFDNLSDSRYNFGLIISY